MENRSYRRSQTPNFRPGNPDYRPETPDHLLDPDSSHERRKFNDERPKTPNSRPVSPDTNPQSMPHSRSNSGFMNGGWAHPPDETLKSANSSEFIPDDKDENVNENLDDDKNTHYYENIREKIRHRMNLDYHPETPDHLLDPDSSHERPSRRRRKVAYDYIKVTRSKSSEDPRPEAGEFSRFASASTRKFNDERPMTPNSRPVSPDTTPKSMPHSRSNTPSSGLMNGAWAGDPDETLKSAYSSEFIPDDKDENLDDNKSTHYYENLVDKKNTQYYENLREKIRIRMKNRLSEDRPHSVPPEYMNTYGVNDNPDDNGSYKSRYFKPSYNNK